MVEDSPFLPASRLRQAVIIAIGGNVPRPGRTVQEGLEKALQALDAVGFQLVARSRWWSSRAWPDPSDPPFLNAVVIAETAHDPQASMAALHRLEAAFGRRRSRANAPRPLDLDLIAYGRVVLDGDLILPHPRAHERLFVMGPLAEIAPGWIHPTLERSAIDLAAEAKLGADAVPVS